MTSSPKMDPAEVPFDVVLPEMAEVYRETYALARSYRDEATSREQALPETAAIYRRAQSAADSVRVVLYDAILAALRDGMSQSKISRLTGVSRVTVGKIWKGAQS